MPVTPRIRPLAWVALGLTIGVAAGSGALAWQRWSFSRQLAEERALAERRIESEADGARAVEASLTARIAQLEADLAKALSAAADAAGDTSGRSGPTQQPPEKSRGLEIIERSVEPEVVEPGAPLTLRVRLVGGAESVTMRIAARDGGFERSYDLGLVSAAGGTQIWESSIAAPSSPGEYRYFAYATRGGDTVEMPGISGWTFLVQ